jgi:hypothetical protein
VVVLRAVTVQLGESSSLCLCRDMESSSQVARLPAATRTLRCEDFILRELSRQTDGFAEEKKIGNDRFGSVLLE